VTSALWWLNITNNPPNPLPAISASLSSSQIIVSWPSAYLGWILQTNTASLNNSAAWGDVPASASQSQMTFPAAGISAQAELFRLRHP
jgi:hypothetical protein